LLLFFFRSTVGVIAPVVVVQLSVIVTVAFVVLLGWKLDMTTRCTSFRSFAPDLQPWVIDGKRW